MKTFEGDVKMALTVNGVAIQDKQLDEAFALRVDEYRKMCEHAGQAADDAQLKQWIEEDAIEGVLFYQAAQEKLPAPTEAQIRKYVAEHPAEFYAVAETDVLEEGKRQLMLHVFRRSLRKQVKRPSAADVEAFYAANPHRFDQPEYWAVSHICKHVPPTESTASIFLLLCRIRQDILDKKVDWQTALNASDSYPVDQGLFGVITRGQYPAFEQKIFALKEMEISEVVDSGENTLHLFMVMRHETARTLTLDEVRSDIEKQLFDDAFAAVLDQTYETLVAQATLVRA